MKLKILQNLKLETNKTREHATTNNTEVNNESSHLTNINAEQQFKKNVDAKK